MTRTPFCPWPRSGRPAPVLRQAHLPERSRRVGGRGPLPGVAPLRAYGRGGRSAARGVALIVVLWVMVILSFLCVSFTREMVLEAESSRYFVDQAQAQLAAASAVARARIALATYQGDPSDPSAGLLLDNPGEFRWVPLTEETGRTWGSSPAASLASRRAGSVAPSEAYYSLVGKRYDSDDDLAFGLIDEAAKLNVNTASWESLARLPEMTDELAQAIVDFRDADSDPLPYGAEDEYYETLEQPYRAKNAPFETLEELLLVKGINSAMLYGEDTNQNGVLDPWENDGNASTPDDDQDSELDRGLAAYVTVYSSEPNVNSAGEARLNLTTASREEVQEALSQGMSSNLVDQVCSVLFPTGGPGGEGTGSDAGGQQSAQSETMANLLVRVPALLERENRQALAYLLDVATVSEEEAFPGLVNVNTAPTSVLAALPGFDEDVAEAIDAYRKQGGADFSSVVWLLDVEAVGPVRFLQQLPLITARSFRYRVHAVGVAGQRHVFRRLEVVLDRSQPEVPPVFWRDVTDWGVPFDFVAEAGEAQ